MSGYDEIKLHVTNAAIDAIKSLQNVVNSPEATDANKIKAANQIVAVFQKAHDHTEVKEMHAELKEHLNDISDNSEYDPEV